MQITVEPRSVVVTGAIESKRADLVANAAMFKLLSKQYSDYPWGIVREYGTNMVDGYTALRRERPDAPIFPPKIKLPTHLGPWIEFIDYGIGMDWDTVWNVFTGYGKTTKDGSNEEAGGFGIGAKIATYWEKCDVWFVESRFDGMKHILHITRDAEGFPLYSRMASIPTEEPNGVTVRIPAPESEWSGLRAAVGKLATYFPMELKIEGWDEEFKRPEYALMGTGWGIHAVKGSNHAVCGNVPYALNVAILHERTGLPTGFLTKMSVDFPVSIGEVSVAPNREHLIYDDRTAACLKKRVETLAAEVRQLAEKEIESQPTLWAACSMVNQKWGNSGLMYILPALSWKGKEFTFTGFRYTLAEVAKALPPDTSFKIADLTGVDGRMSKNRLRLVITSKDATKDVQERRIMGEATEIENLYAAFSAQPFTVIVDDAGKEGTNRIRHYLTSRWTYDSSSGKRYRKSGCATQAWVVSREGGLTEEAVSAAFFGMPVLFSSDLADPPQEERQRKQVSLKRFDTSSSTWLNAQVESSAGGFYVPLVGRNWDEFLSDLDLRRLIKGAVEIGVFDEEPVVYGIPRTLKRLEEQGQWVHLFEFVHKEVTKRVKDEAEQLGVVDAWVLLVQDPIAQLFGKCCSELPEGSLPRRLGEKYREVEALARKLHVLKGCMRILNIEQPGFSGDDPRQMLEEIYEKYPMSKVLEKAFVPPSLYPVVGEYVRQMDAARASSAVPA